MAESLLERSARYIDGSVYEGPESVNPVDRSFHEIADGVGLVCGFSHIWTLDAGEGLVVGGHVPARLGVCSTGASPPVAGRSGGHHRLHARARGPCQWRAGLSRRRRRSAGRPSPRVVAHDAVGRRFDRYELTRGYNECINARQFGRRYRAGFFDIDWVQPQVTYSDSLELEVGQTRMQLMHEKGETDDHTIAWVPQQGVLFTGDLIIWAFPNAGNPQKAQRYPLEWAAALRRMIDLRPSLLAPAHGLPVAGTERIARVLDDTATALEGLVRDTLEMMNSGARLDEIVHTVRVPTDLLERPYLHPSYDEPEFVVRNIWRLYGGWHDANPARLKPPPDHAVAAEVAALAGGAGALARRATELCDAGELRLACQLVEWAAQAAPADEEVHAARAEVYRIRRDSEQSLMARNLFRDAFYSSKTRVQPEQAPD